MRIIEMTLAAWVCSFVLLIPQDCHAVSRQAAPGVFFHHSEKGGNIGWIVFDRYVLVIDSNFQDEAGKLAEEIQSKSGKPVRFVFNTHHHGDHVRGNGVFVSQGASVIAQRHCADSIESAPTLLFDDRLLLDDGTKRVEFLHFGHGHTQGDAVAYLPNEKILFTGDLCVNGAYNYMGEAYTEDWIDILSALQELNIETVCPGHGQTAGKELLQTQKEYFIHLREAVKKESANGQTIDEILKNIEIPGYKEWTGKPPREENIRHVYEEWIGIIPPRYLLDMDMTEGRPPKDTPGWTPPKKLLAQGVYPTQLPLLKRLAPNLEFVEVKSPQEALEKIGDVDGAIGPITKEMFQASKKLRWVHSRTAGVEKYLFPEFAQSSVVLTNGRGVSGPAIADHVLGYILTFSKGLDNQYKQQLQGRWKHDRTRPIHDLQDKTLLILGFGGIGRKVARRASGFGMKIIAIDPKNIDRPNYVSHIGPPDELDSVLPEADYVVCCVPLVKQTYRYLGRKRFQLMKPSAFFINVSRGKVIDQKALIEALRQKEIAGAALDVTDPEPLPDGHPLWSMKNVIITPHMSGRTFESERRMWHLLRENIRRFATGESLLNVVNKKAGY